MKTAMYCSMIALCTAAAPAGNAQTVPSFCERLAPDLGLKAVADSKNSSVRVWKADLANLGMYLVGGSTFASIQIDPVEGVDNPLFLKQQDACTYTGKGVNCRIVGVSRVEIHTRKAAAKLDAAPDDRAEVEIRATKIFCRDHKPSS